MAAAKWEKGGSWKPELGLILGVAILGNFEEEKKCAVREAAEKGAAEAGNKLIWG